MTRQRSTRITKFLKQFLYLHYYFYYTIAIGWIVATLTNSRCLLHVLRAFNQTIHVSYNTNKKYSISNYNLFDFFISSLITCLIRNIVQNITSFIVSFLRNFTMIEKIGAVYLIKSYDCEGRKYLE